MSRAEASMVKAPSATSVIEHAIRKLEAAQAAVQLHHFRSGLELLAEAESLVSAARYVLDEPVVLPEVVRVLAGER